MLGHVSGIPVEELVLPLAGGTGSLLAARVFLWTRFRDKMGR